MISCEQPRHGLRRKWCLQITLLWKRCFPFERRFEVCIHYDFWHLNKAHLVTFFLSALLSGHFLFCGLIFDLLWPQMSLNTGEKRQHLETVEAKKTEKWRTRQTRTRVELLYVCSCRVGITVYLHVTAMKVCTRPRLTWHAFLWLCIFTCTWAVERVARQELIKTGCKSSRDGKTSCIGASSWIPAG